MNLEEEYERSLLKTKLLNIAAQLQNDHKYTKEKAVEEILELIDYMKL